MNVRITPRGAPFRTDLYGGIDHVRSDGQFLRLYREVPWLVQRALDRGDLSEGPFTPPVSHAGGPPIVLRLSAVAEIALDDEPGDWY